MCVLLILAACDHKPAPSQSSPAPTPTVSADAATGLVAVAGGDTCMQIGTNVAEIIIAATADPQQKAAYEQERAKMVKRFSDNCQRESWSDATKGCFLAAKTQTDVDACSRELAKTRPAPPPAPPRPPEPASGSGLKRD